MAEWLTAAEFASIAGISVQKARRALARAAEAPSKPWRGYYLETQPTHGRGGVAGAAREVNVESLPEPFKAAWKARGRPVQLALPLRLDDAASAERRERMLIIEPIVVHPERSAERRAALRAAIGTTIIRNGRREALSETTLRRWMKDLAEGGEAALQRKARRDKNTVRHDVSQRWDAAAAGLPEAVRAEIAAKLHKFLFSRWGEGCSFAMVKRLGETRLAELTRKAGCSLSAAELLASCALPKHLVERTRSDGLKVFTRRRDAKAHDDSLPRVRLTHRGLAPMALVYGDVHHLDVYVMREDGTLATPKAIAWLDAATRRLRIDLVLCEVGGGIRNADLIQSFIEMTQDPEWGVPSRLYLDNGSEYNFADFLADPLKLASLGCTVDPITRARPYNAAAKGALEGSFRSLERLLVPLKGSIPGNRMLTRSANLGKAPVPYDGSFDDFARTFRAILNFHNTQPQRGDLGGVSPDAAFRRAVAAGWARVDVDGDALRTAFSVTEYRTVSRGKIRVGAEWLYCDGLFKHNGERVRIQRPKYLSWDGVAVYDRRDVFIGVAHFDEVRDPLDRDGAREAARRRRVAFDASAALVGEADDESAVELIVAQEAARPRPAKPKSAGKITLAPEAAEITRQTRSTPAQRQNHKSTEAQKRQEARLALLDELEGR